MTDAVSGPNLIELATELTTAWLANPNTRVSAEDVPAFLERIHGAVASLASPVPAEVAPAAEEYTPAVTVRRSLSSKDHIISLIDGKPYKTLKRHLSNQGLTPVQYRERYGLKSDYPMVSETYAAMRRDLAKKIGLGRKPGTKLAAKPAAKQSAKPAAAAAAAPEAAPAAKAPAKPAAKAKAAAPVATAAAKAMAKPAAKPKAAKAPKAVAAPKPAPAPQAAPAEGETQA